MHDMGTPPGNLSGPVERLVEPSVVAPAHLNVHDYAAASRQRGAERAGFVKGMRKGSGPPPVPAAPTTHPLTGFKRSPEVRERMRLAQLARYAKARGETPAAHDHSQVQEAGVPATDAVAVEQPERDGSTVGSTPPGPTSPEEPASVAPLEPGLPCVTCSHAVVCSIRPELEAWIGAQQRPVSPLAAITIVAARLELACEHYLARLA